MHGLTPWFDSTTCFSLTTTLFALHGDSVALTQPAGAKGVSGLAQPVAV